MSKISEYVQNLNSKPVYCTRKDCYYILQTIDFENLEVALLRHEWYSAYTHGPQDQSDQIIAITSSGKIYHNVWVLIGIKRIIKVIVDKSGAKALVEWSSRGVIGQCLRPTDAPREDWVCMREPRR